MRKLLFFLPVLLLLGMPVFAENFDYNNLFEQAFGKKQQQTLPSQIKVPLIIDTLVGKEVLVYTSNGNIRIDATALLEQLDKVALSKVIMILKQAIKPDNTLSKTALEQAGLTAKFNNSNLSFNVTIPLELQKTKELNLFGQKRPRVENLQKPAKVNGYIYFPLVNWVFIIVDNNRSARLPCTP